MLATVLAAVLSACSSSGMGDPKNPDLTARQADRQVKKYKHEIFDLAAPQVKLHVSSMDGHVQRTVKPSNCKFNDDRPDAPSFYEYWYDANGKRHDPRFPPVARRIVKHFTAQGWKIKDHATEPALEWTLTSPENYGMSVIISPGGDLLGIDIGTPCVPRVATPFTA